MTKLQSIHCVGCEGGIPPLNKIEIEQLLSQINGWKLNQDMKFISKKFNFKNFYKTMLFVNAIAWISDKENHHPELEVTYNNCVVRYKTHSIDALTKNDFICAAKIDLI